MCLLLMVFGGPGVGMTQELPESEPFGLTMKVDANGQEVEVQGTSGAQGATAVVSDPFFVIPPTIKAVPGKGQRHIKDYINDGLTFGCLNTQTGEILTNRKITVEPERVDNSGGHPESTHSALSGNDPKKDGMFDNMMGKVEGNTGSDGLQFQPDYTSAEAGGEVELKLTCFQPDGMTISSTGSLFAHVRTDPLVSLPASHPSYVFEGNATTNTHQDTHYLRPNSLPRFIQFADDFFAVTGKVIRFNDASLVWGGVFDDRGTYEQPRHLWHRVGEEVDIDNTLAQGGTGAPAGPAWTPSDQNQLRKMVNSTGAVIARIPESNERHHYHIRDTRSSFQP